ncbi:hypothetical protein [Paractinoplanes lichenicola]|uniref:Uncharacterized protein n=1 Tax=Paractinoplanes lichenicola TaxID=2802976 RepID=A0ABS1VF20_9ACTN|nr:hypothetical protein [Actinoplanes lichenicola]MBL7253292.1 hypothetical protein [Actinoplanes lichenicola]
MTVSTVRRIGTRTVSIGVHEDPDVTPAETRRNYPAARIGREFIPPLKPGVNPRKVLDKIKEFAEKWSDGGVYVSYKPPPREVRAGAWTDVHRGIGQWLAKHPEVAVIVHHEPEGGAGRLEGPEFARMFKQARDEIKDGWSGARVVYCAMAYQWGPSGDVMKNPAPWRGVEADEYLCDVYSGKTFPTEFILPKHPGYVAWYDQIVRPRLRNGETVAYGLAERGFMGNDELRAKAIRRESAWLRGVFEKYEASGDLLDLPPCAYLAWSSVGWENEKGWLLHGDSAVAMRELLADFDEHVR